MKCTHCNGAGTNSALVRYATGRGSDCRWEEITCRECAGTGIGDPEKERVSAYRHQLHIERRSIRMERDASLREMGAERGMTPMQYSEWEWAKNELPPANWQPTQEATA